MINLGPVVDPSISKLSLMNPAGKGDRIQIDPP